MKSAVWVLESGAGGAGYRDAGVLHRLTRDFGGFWGGIRGEDAVVGGADFTGTSE